MHRSLLTLAMTALATATAATAEPALTIYRSDSGVLFAGGTDPVADGNAVVHEQRSLQLGEGQQTIVMDGLPSMLDTEAVAVDLGGAGRILAQRVVSPGGAGALAAHRGARIQVFGSDNRLIAEGILVALDGAGLGIRDRSGDISYIHDYTRIVFPQGSGMPGSTLQVMVDGKAGNTTARLTYPTSGLGWRAAYSALLADGDACRLRLDALASIANRSGRDFSGANLKLVAGEPNFSRSDFAPRGMMKTMAAAAPEAMPVQSSLGDYRSYAIGGNLDLPDGSVTQVPLYASSDIDCQRSWVFENGGAWFPQKPNWTRGGGQPGSGPVTSQLKFTAAENLPSGNLRVLTRDKDGRIELLGENRIGDIAKGRDVDVSLGIAFDLSGKRELASFNVDRAARRMDEGFRITLTNSGETPRTVTVREHPNRWRNWTVLSSSQEPSKKTPDTLEFQVEVAANSAATLDYSVRYTWTAQDESSP